MDAVVTGACGTSATTDCPGASDIARVFSRSPAPGGDSLSSRQPASAISPWPRRLRSKPGWATPWLAPRAKTS